MQSIRWALACALLLCAGSAHAAEEEVVEVPASDEEPPFFTTSVNGYGDTRWALTGVSTNTLAPSNQVPVVANLTEANTQLRFTWPTAQALVDASFFYQMGTVFFGRVNGVSQRIPNQDVLAYRPLALLNEFYAIYSFSDSLNLTVGKKRIVWGPGLVNNPTDLLNPPKDPTDPAFQRSGTWLTRLEMPLEKMTFSLVGAAEVLREYGGVPAGLLAYPAYPTYEHTLAPAAFPDDRDSYKHFAAIARMYALVSDADINLVYQFTHHYHDLFAYKSRAGITAQRFVWTTLELHFEAEGQLGSARPYANAACMNNPSLLAMCATQGQLLQNSKLANTTPNTRLLAGGSYTFGNDAQLTVEYLFDSTGYTDDEFRAYVDLLGAVQVANAQGQHLALPTSTAADPGSPQKFTFNNLRQHYIFITYMQPHIFDDWTVNAVVMLGAEDLSGLFAPSIIWSARSWLNITAYGFVPWDGPSGLRLPTVFGNVSEFGLLPIDARIMLSARVFY